MQRDLSLTVKYYEQEKNLLLAFLAYIRNANVHTVGYFNGHKFDLPFIIARLRYLKLSACVSAKQTGVSLTHREDSGLITQRRKGASKTYKSDAIKNYKTEVKESFMWRTEAQEGGGNGSRGDDQGDYDDNDDAYDNPSGGHDDMPPTFPGGGNGGFGERGKVGRYMMEARKNMTISMHNVGLLDVMYEVGDKNRGCKLDTAALEWLGVQKIKDERVSYENITKTWRDGDVDDLEALAAYCIRDTLLTVLLAKKKQVAAFYMGDSTLSYMNMRELYTGEMVKSTICTQANYGHPYSVSSPDTTFLRHEGKLWEPDYDFDIDSDMYHLAPLAGRTVQNSGYYDIPIGTVDYSGQYPSIQRAHNICSSTWVTEKQSKQLPEDAFITKTLYNVRPKVTHTCAVDVCKAQRGEPDKCTFSTNYETVEYDIRYVKRDFFHGLIPQSLEDLANLRKDYKQKMKDSADGIETQLYDTLQKAVKCRMNAAYGVTLRITPLVGTTITQFGREQTEMAARLGVDAGMVVVNGDTDSVMLMHKPACLPVESEERCENMGWLSRMSYNLLATPQAPINLIFKALIDQFEEFCKMCNHQLPPPCSLEFEKLFTYQRMDEKKCYLGQKVLPDLSMRSHIAGMTGMKADRTRVKSAAQFIPGKLTSARDFEGLAAFATDLYDVVSMRLRAHEIGRVKVEQLANDIDIELETFVREKDIVSRPSNEALRVPHLRKVMSVESIIRVANNSRRAREALSEFDSQGEQSRIERVNNPMGDIIPLSWLTSSEKVGDLTDPKTRATKEAILSCKRRGDSIHGCGQLFIDVLRNHDVQVSAPLSKSIAVLLRAPEEEGVKKRRRARMMKRLAQTDCKRMITLEDRREEEERKKKNVINKLTITAMPADMVAVPEDRVQISERERALLFDAQIHIALHDNLIKKERADKYATLLIHPKTIAPERGERLRSYIEHYTPNDLFVPLWWYDEEYCETWLPADTVGWWTMPHRLSAASLWSMYVNRKDKWREGERYMLVQGGDRIKIMMTAEIDSDIKMLDCDHSSWNRNHVHELKDDTIIGLDMRDRYAHQTRSTPYVISSVDGGQRFLTNKDSYCLNRANRFSFQIDYTHFNSMVRMCGSNACLAFKMLTRTNHVSVTGNMTRGQLCNVKILRDDGRDSTYSGWLWDDVYYVEGSSIVRRLSSLMMMGCQKNVDQVQFSFHMR